MCLLKGSLRGARIQPVARSLDGLRATEAEWHEFVHEFGAATCDLLPNDAFLAEPLAQELSINLGV